jgi:hypothetical protein
LDARSEVALFKFSDGYSLPQHKTTTLTGGAEGNVMAARVCRARGGLQLLVGDFSHLITPNFKVPAAIAHYHAP